MLASFLPLFLALHGALARWSSYEEASRLSATGPTFLFLCSSLSFDYTADVIHFADAARTSELEANFLIIDAAVDRTLPPDLDLTILPVLLSYEPREYICGPVTLESMLRFFSHRTPPAIMTIRTEADLQFFFDVAGFGVLASFENASDRTLPAFVELHRYHLTTVTVAFCDPRILGKEGFFLYRFTDNAFFEITTDFFAVPPGRAEPLLGAHAIPELFKVDPFLLETMESSLPRLGILVLDMRGRFYLTGEQIGLAREVKERCGVTVCYESANISMVSPERYNFPDVVKWEEFWFIDFTQSKVREYRMLKPLTIENAVQFCYGIADGLVPPIPELPGDPIDTIAPTEATKYIQDGWAAVGFCEGDSHCVRNLSLAKRDLRIHGMADVKVAEFSKRFGEWPSTIGSFENTPKVVIFRDGSVVATMPPPTASPAVITDEILYRARALDKEAL
jgi:hypothetical protein